MRRNIITCFLLIAMAVSFMPNISSEEDVYLTKVTITTEPLRDVLFIAYGSDGKILQEFDERSYTEGVTSFQFYTIEPAFDYSVNISRGGKQIEFKEEKSHTAGEDIVLTLGIGKDVDGEIGSGNESLNETNKINESVQEELPVEEEKVSEDESTESGISGAAITGNNNPIKNLWYYLIGGILVAGLLGFLVTRRIISSHNTKGNAVVQQKAAIVQGVIGESDIELRIKNAESRIREAQSELKKIREDEKIKTAERKIQQEIDELNKLKKSRDSV